MAKMIFFLAHTKKKQHSPKNIKMIYPKTSKNAKRDERRREKNKSAHLRITPRMKKKYKKYTIKKNRKSNSVKEQTCKVTPTRNSAKRVSRFQSKAAVKIQAVVRGRLARLFFRKIRLKDIRYKLFTHATLTHAFKVGGLAQRLETFYNFVSNPHFKSVASVSTTAFHSRRRYNTVLNILKTENAATEKRIYSSRVELDTETLIKFYAAKHQIYDMEVTMRKCKVCLEQCPARAYSIPLLRRQIATDIEPYPYFGM